MLALLLIFMSCAFAAQQKLLGANALVPCMGLRTVTANEFSVLYDHVTRVIYYNASVDVTFSGYVYADVELYVYGYKAISERVNPCTSSALKQLCPLSTGAIDVQSNSVLSSSITKHIPGIAFNVPDLDAYLIVKVRDSTSNDLLSCLYIPIYNMRTVQQTAVKWVTAILGGIGLAISCLLIYLGTSVNAMNISAVTVLMLNYFQSMAFLDMEAVERIPPIASAWNENIIWSVGLIYTSFMQKIFRWYVQATGGSPTTYLTYASKPVLVQKLKRRAEELVITPRVADWVNSIRAGPHKIVTGMADLIRKRDNSDASEAFAQSSDTLVVYRGIERTAYDMHIEVTNAVLTTYTFFIFICVCVVFVFSCIWLFLRWKTRRQGTMQAPVPFNEKQDLEHMSSGETQDNSSYKSEGNAESDISPRYETRAQHFYHLLPVILKGTLLKLWLVAFPPIMVFSMWEWTRDDSAAVIVVSVFMFVICLVLFLFNQLRMMLVARKSAREAGTPAYLLYSDTHTLQRYGYLYTMFSAEFYFFGFVYAAYNFVKSCFIGFSAASGKTQALAIFIIELAMCITVCVIRPFLSKAVNGIQITTHVIITLNAMFFLFFSNLMTQPLIVNGVMGVIYFILNAAFSLVLLLYIIIFSVICLLWSRKKHETHDPLDNRQSFILNPDGPAQAEAAAELQALGRATQEDHIAETEEPRWFHKPSLQETQNPFEPPIVPPTPQYRGERYSFSSPRTFTMNSDSTRDVPVLNELDRKHQNCESQSSIALT